MASSYKLLSILGIGIEVHWSLVLLLFIILLVSPSLFVLWVLLFIFVTLHELTHSIVAKRIGIRVKKIMLIAIGGVAMMDVSNVKPVDEIKMAIVGPLFNFAVCILMILLASAIGYPLVDQTNAYLANPDSALPLLDTVIVFIFWVNLLLGSFNLLIPAFPLDGGRVLRGILALRMDYLKATDISRKLSYGLAIGLFVVSLFGVFGNPIWMGIVSLFIVMGATSEYNGLVTNLALRKINLSKFVTRSYITLRPSETLSSAAAKFKSNIKTSAIVSTKPLKILNVNDLVAVPKEKWSAVKVGQAAVFVRPVTLETHPDDVMQRMNEIKRGMIPVVQKGKFIGVILYEQLEKAVKINQMLG